MADALVKHAFVSAIPEGPNAALIRTSNWNAALLFTAGAAGDLLVRDTGSATGAAWSAVLAAANGGTGQAVYAVGDLLYASTTTALSRRAAVAAGQLLLSTGVGAAPAWSGTALVYAGTVLSAPYMNIEQAFRINSNNVLASWGSVTNIFVGNAAGATGATGVNNVGVGQTTMSTLTTGANNVGVGRDALKNVVAGAQNVAIGTNALLNSVGSSSVAIGHEALKTSTQSTSNVAIGQSALFSLPDTSAGHNVAVGVQAGYDWTTANGNIALGVDAGRGFNLTGDNRFIAGSYTWPITDVYFGSGEGTGDASAPIAYVIHGAGANSLNAAGANITIAAGRGTGTGLSGEIVFQIAPAGGSGSTQNALADAFRITAAGDFKWGKALVALGGGAAPTLGTIGGSGPATAAQNTWMRVLDSAGAAFWVPAWK